MPEPLDQDGYPTEATIDALTTLAPALALDLARAAWRWPDFVTEDLRPAEREIVAIDGEGRFIRFATGGWSGHERVIGALNRNWKVRTLCWRLSARGGLHIYEYPQ